jgi:hypothetical protein
MKRIVLALAVLGTVAGCATTSGQQDGAPVVTNLDSGPMKIGQVMPFPDGRMPAQAATRTYWAEDSKSINITPSGGTANVTLNPRQIEIYQQRYNYDCDKYTWGTVPVTDYVCTGGTGKSDLWNAYYGAPKEQKAKKLDDALKGISKSARNLDETQIFKTKPKSWQEFRQRMNTALRKGIINEEEYKNVFGTFGEDNRRNLGYAGETCTAQLTSMEVYGLFSVPNGCTGTREAQRQMGTKPVPVQLTVRNPQLQSFETEDITVKAGEDYESIQVLRSDKTEYVMQKSSIPNGAAIVLEGKGRFQVALPSKAFQEVSFNDGAGKNMNVLVAVDPNFLGHNTDKLIFSVQVNHCVAETGWFGGECKGKDAQVMVKEPVQYQTITQAKSSFALPTIPAGNRVWVSYSLFREGSKWYNNAPIGIVQEQKLKELKK